METCIACSGDDVLKESQIEGYVQGSYYTVFSCLSCATKWVSPHGEDSAVYNLIYSNDDTPGYMRYKEYAKEILHSYNPLKFLALKEEMYYSVSKSVKSNLKKGEKILDVGCGLGYMTYALVQAGYNATGLDISEEAITQAKEKYGNYFACGDFFTFDGVEGGYDAICMLELIEHISDPKKYIKRAIELLSTTGVLIITTPNRSWYPEKSLWETDLPSVHLTWFSEKGISLLANRVQMTAKFFHFTFYNLFYGTLLKPVAPNFNVRKSFFSKNGNPLYPRYTKSQLRIKAEKLGIYNVLKKIHNIINKLHDFIRVVRSPSSLCLTKSNIICVTMYRK